MMKYIKKLRGSLCFQLPVAFVLIYAGVNKVIDPQAFYEGLLKYQLGSENVLVSIAFLVPVIEILAGLTLFWRPLRRGGYFLSFSLFLGFQIFLYQAKYRGLELNCACFGSHSQGSSLNESLLRNTVLISFLLISLFYLRLEKKGLQND